MTENQKEKLKALAYFQEVASIYDVCVEYEGTAINNPWLDASGRFYLENPAEKYGEQLFSEWCKKAEEYINAHSEDSF